MTMRRKLLCLLTPGLPLPIQEEGGEVVGHLQEEEVELLQRKIDIVSSARNKVIQRKKSWKKYGKPDWATKNESTTSASTLSNAMAAECITTAAATGSVTLSHDDFEHLLKLAHQYVSQPSAASAQSSNFSNFNSSLKPWPIDSAATGHMTSTTQLFSAISPFKTPVFVSLADGSKVPAIGKGSVLLNPQMEISDVLLAPFPMSHLSVK